jgi:hypothetical protein
VIPEIEKICPQKKGYIEGKLANENDVKTITFYKI